MRHSACQVGSVPVAYVVAQEEVSEQSLLTYCAQQLAPYKIPTKIYFVDQLPRNGANKLLRRKLGKQ